MKDYKLAEKEALCEATLNWKKSTTYTVLKKLCGRGIFQNHNAIVVSLVSREEFASGRTMDFVKKSFCGSLPGFITAFMGNKRLSEKQAEEIKKLIDSYREVE